MFDMISKLHQEGRFLEPLTCRKGRVCGDDHYTIMYALI